MTTLLFFAYVVHADPIHDLKKAIKSGNHARVLELCSTLAVSQEEFNRLQRYTNKKLESQPTEQSPLKTVWSYAKACSAVAAGAVVGTLAGVIAASSPFLMIRGIMASDAEAINKGLIGVSAGGIVTIGAGALCEYGVLTIRQNRNAKEQCSNAAKIIATIQALRVTPIGPDTNVTR